jgi:hypothetical protein
VPRERGSIERSEERIEPRRGYRVSGSSRNGRPTRAAAAAAASGKRRLPLPVILGGMLIVGLAALLALNTASAALEVRNRSVTAANTSVSDTEQQLLRDLAGKQAPASLAAAATALGLVPNENPAFLRLNANGSVSVLGSPVPATAPPVAVPTPKPAPKPSAKATPSAAVSKPARPAASSSKAASPVVTVTVTRAATPSSSTTPGPHSSPSPSPSSTASGGHG